MAEELVAKDFSVEREIKWCPGCGDYSILKQVQQILPELGIPRENIVFVSGIGCSSRFPYYMNTYGIHSIHGRAPSIATGLKLANPELSVWIITGDGDALSIGGNHLIHILRRNLDTNILLFNNEIYGLTKGQYSPTSHLGLKTKSSPLGVIDAPFNPLGLALGAHASFIARTMDKNPAHLREVLKKAEGHKGTSLVEIYQNCIIFNDNAFDSFTNKLYQSDTVIWLENGKPLLFGENNSKGIILDGLTPRVVSMEDVSVNDLWIHNETDATKGYLLTQMFEDSLQSGFPRPFGVLYHNPRQTFNELFFEQHHSELDLKKDINSILGGSSTWEV